MTYTHNLLFINPNSLLHFVSAPPPPCYDGQVQLREITFASTADGYNYTEGLVEVCINETYTAICDEGWDNNAAAVVCRSLGLNAPYYGML